ncbi:MAG: 50S ribosomal protein L18, partial [Nanoarchaeota archaeon]|nr:50S ribosomal protein L18 [Nanoarchaeota archaeon]
MIVEYSPSGDKTSKLVTSKSLKKYGWELGLKNTPAAYLTGFLIGKTGGVKEAIVDKGRHTMSKGSFIRYFIKGALDAGMDLHVKEMDIDKERMVGKHILDYYSKDSSKFSELGDKIKLITDEFNKVIEKINQENGR